MEELTKTAIFFIVVSILIVVFIVFRWQSYKIKEWEKNAVLTTAIITRIGNVSSFQRDPYNYMSLKYTYKVNNHAYEGSRDLKNRSLECRKMFIGKKIPVLYDKTDPEGSVLILYDYNYEDHGLIMPDSMKWISTCR